MYRKLVLIFVFVITIIFRMVNIDIDDNSHKDISIDVTYDNRFSKFISMPLGSTYNDLIKELNISNDYEINKHSLDEVLFNNEVITFELKKEKSLISINTASLDLLMTLPGIGEKLANRIIDYRNEYGLFSSLEEIKNVNGIGTKKYEQLKEFISL